MVSRLWFAAVVIAAGCESNDGAPASVSGGGGQGGSVATAEEPANGGSGATTTGTWSGGSGDDAARDTEVENGEPAAAGGGAGGNPAATAGQGPGSTASGGSSTDSDETPAAGGGASGGVGGMMGSNNTAGVGGAANEAPMGVVIDPSLASQVIAIDPASTYQTFEGFGTSLCWFGNVVGSWADARRQEVADLLFDNAEGLGLNVIRYNIGGGDAPDHDHMGAGKQMPGFKNSESASYDWSADAAQRWMLDAAISRIPEGQLIMEAFSNSPPYWMTASGCASGNGEANNLPTDRVTDFADYLSDVVLHFRDEWGVRFRTLEPMNEPNGTWWSANGAQEGARIDRPLQATLLNAVRASLDARGLDDVQLGAPDESSYDETVDSYNSYDSATRALVSQINTHVYSGSERAELRQLAERDGKRLWSSEVDGSGAPAPFDAYPHDHDDIVPGLDLAHRIVRDLREMRVHAWVFWQAMESEQAQSQADKNWGLLHGDYEGTSESFSITKKYHVMKQYSRAIRPGAVMIDIDQEDAIAFYHPDTSAVTIVQRNSGDEAVWAYDLSQFASLAGTASVVRTSQTEAYTAQPDLAIVDGVLVATIAAQSVTSFSIGEAIP